MNGEHVASLVSACEKDRAFCAAFLASILLHAALLVFTSRFHGDGAFLQVGRLEVLLVPASELPVGEVSSPRGTDDRFTPGGAASAPGMVSPALAPSTPAVASRGVTQDSEAPVAEKLLSAAGTASAPAAPAASPAQSPGAGAASRVDIEFAVLAGGVPAGLGRHTYTAAGDGGFGVLVSNVGTAGRDGGGEWSLEISGRIDEHGLTPLLFRARGMLSERFLALKEPNVAGEAGAVMERQGRMPDGILDRQSLLYQFMLVPPAPGGGALWLSDGKTYARYVYRLAPVEIMLVPSLGSVRAIKLTLTSEAASDTIELWLLPEKRYLPARVRHVDKSGFVTEQVATTVEVH